MVQVVNVAMNRIVKGVLPECKASVRQRIMTTALEKYNIDAQKEMSK